MKKNNIKNRKVELRNKRFFLISSISGCLIICISVGLSYFLFVAPHQYLSPIVLTKQLSSFSNQTYDAKPIITQSLDEAKISFVRIEQVDRLTYKITLNQDETVFISSGKDIPQQLASLQLITSRLTMEGKRFSRLDLRYAKPVIVF